jgi:hypothetical protein
MEVTDAETQRRDMILHVQERIAADGYIEIRDCYGPLYIVAVDVSDDGSISFVMSQEKP